MDNFRRDKLYNASTTLDSLRESMRATLDQEQLANKNRPANLTAGNDAAVSDGAVLFLRETLNNLRRADAAIAMAGSPYADWYQLMFRDLTLAYLGGLRESLDVDESDSLPTLILTSTEGLALWAHESVRMEGVGLGHVVCEWDDIDDDLKGFMLGKRIEYRFLTDDAWLRFVNAFHTIMDGGTYSVLAEIERGEIEFTGELDKREYLDAVASCAVEARNALKSPLVSNSRPKLTLVK